MDYEKRLKIPIVSDGTQKDFYTKSGTKVGTGYARVVIGKRGPYVEFSDDQIIKASLIVPNNQAWRLDEKYSYIFYIEYRSNDESFVKFYFQKKEVDYADYKIGLWYASPFDLVVDGESIIEKIK